MAPPGAQWISFACLVPQSDMNPFSNSLHWRGEAVSSASLCYDQRWRACVGLDLAAQPQDLYVNAPVENLVVMNATGSKQLLATQHALRRLDEGGQKTKLPVGKLHVFPRR